MKPEIKIVSNKKYREIEAAYGAKIQYIDLDLLNGPYRCIVNLDKINEVYIPRYFAEDILNQL